MQKSLKSRITCILRSKLELKLKIVWRARAADYSFTYTFQTRGARGVALKVAAGRNDKSRHDQTSSMERSKNKIRNGKNKTMYRRKLAITAVAAVAAAAAAASAAGATAVKSSAPVNYVIMPGNLHLAARHYILHAFCLPTGIQLDIPNMVAQWTIFKLTKS